MVSQSLVLVQHRGQLLKAASGPRTVPWPSSITELKLRFRFTPLYGHVPTGAVQNGRGQYKTFLDVFPLSNEVRTVPNNRSGPFPSPLFGGGTNSGAKGWKLNTAVC